MLLQMKDINKSIGVTEILGNISFMIQEKEKVALVGVNGAGKTSIFRLLTGEWQPDEGHITKPQGMTMGYLPQVNSINIEETSQEDETTLYDALDEVFAPLKQMEKEMRQLETQMAALQDDALASALKKYDRLSIDFKDQGGFEMTSRLKGVLKGLGFDESQWTQNFATLSGGERTRALLGKLLLGQADLLLLDEPTNHRHRKRKMAGRIPKNFPKGRAANLPRPIFHGQGSNQSNRNRTQKIQNLRRQLQLLRAEKSHRPRPGRKTIRRAAKGSAAS